MSFFHYNELAKERKIVKSIGFTLSLLDELEWLVDKGNPNRQWVSISDAVHKLTSIGLFIIKSGGKVDSTELIKEMNGIIKEERMMEWVQSLSPSQRIGLREMVQIEEDRMQKHF